MERHRQRRDRHLRAGVGSLPGRVRCAAGRNTIHFADIDADETTQIDPNIEAFVFTANDGFGAFTAAGQIRFEITSAGTLIWAETTGDNKADFSILVLGQHHFVTGDFVL